MAHSHSILLATITVCLHVQVAGEPFAAADNPARMCGPNAVFNVDALPASGVTSGPAWASTYIPAFLDSANVQWQPGQPSAVAKYQAAFQTPPGLEDRISAATGIDSLASSFPTCPLPATGPGTQGNCRSGSACGCRTGNATDCHCIPTWIGSCDRWAAASTTQPSPQCAVQYGNVSFQEPDIKILTTLSYAKGVSVAACGTRCNRDNVPTDPSGRMLDAACRSVNAGTFHVVLGNVIGLQGRGLIADLSDDAQVWNFPCVSYTVASIQPVSAEQAASWTSPWSFEYQYNAAATQFRYVELHMRYVVETTIPDLPLANDVRNISRWTKQAIYQYVLELDDGDNILGGEYIGSSKAQHPNMLWLVTGKADNTSVADIQWSNVRMLLQASQSAC